MPFAWQRQAPTDAIIFASCTKSGSETPISQVVLSSRSHEKLSGSILEHAATPSKAARGNANRVEPQRLARSWTCWWIHAASLRATDPSGSSASFDVSTHRTSTRPGPGFKCPKRGCAR